MRNLEKQACVDSLTQVYNRDFFTGRLEERIYQCLFNETEISLLMIDIDNFKSINDTHGHLAGDTAISWTAKIIKDFFGDSALVARYGGDEFVVLMDAVDLAEMNDTANKLCRQVVIDSPQLTGRPEPISISIGGVFCMIKAPEPSLETRIIDLADQALYMSKTAGGNHATIVERLEDHENDASESGNKSAEPTGNPIALPVDSASPSPNDVNHA